MNARAGWMVWAVMLGLGPGLVAASGAASAHERTNADRKGGFTVARAGAGAASQGAARQSAPAPKILYVKCGTLIYDTEKAPLQNADVVITDGKITAVGQDLAAPAGAETVDLSQDTVLPGFLDAHIHLWTGGRAGLVSGPAPAPLAALRAQKDMKHALSLGIAGVRVVGSPDFLDVALGKAIDEGTIPGPHVIPAGHAISIIGGHGDFLDFPPEIRLASFYTPLNGYVNSPADAEAAVHLQIKYGAKVIKVLASGGVLSPLDSPFAEQLSPEELKVICEQAHMANLKVASHAENIRSILASLQAGVDSIEHGSDLNLEAIEYMKEHHVYLDPTVFIVGFIQKNGERIHMPEFALRKANELAKKHFASFALALQNNVTMAAGSDQSYGPTGGTVLDEMIALVEHGMTPEQALTAATKHNAELMGLEGMGTIAVGKEGSLVAVGGNPLNNIEEVKNTKAVIFKGEVVPFAGMPIHF